jgi:pantetheine-phosphate adenylyltransferase
MHTALVPGTYDPITLGHRDVIERTAQLFDQVIVGVAASLKKGGGPLFSIEERVAFAEDALSDLKNVSVKPFSNLLVDFAVEVGARTIVKGLRAVTDFELEFQQASLNYRLNPDLETVFIMSNPEHMYLSSSIVREIAELHGTINPWVTPTVLKALNERFA